MSNKDELNRINGDLAILQMQKELIESKDWDDKTHLENKYPMHANSFYNVVHRLCNSLGIFNMEMDKEWTYSLKLQSGEQRKFDISKDYNNQKGKDKLLSYTEINDKTGAHTLLHYSPTKGIAFEYAANLLPKNIQLGKNDFFGKTIEDMITNVASATNGIEFLTNVDRFKKSPKGLRYFYAITKDFVPKEKQEDVIGIISTLDGLVQGLHKIPTSWLSSENFVHEESEPLFKVGIKITI